MEESQKKETGAWIIEDSKSNKGFKEKCDEFALTDHPIKYGLWVEGVFGVKKFTLKTISSGKVYSITFERYSDNLYYSHSGMFVPVVQNYVYEYFKRIGMDCFLFQPYGTCLQTLDEESLQNLSASF